MTHVGMYIDEKEPPKGRCKPYIIGKAKKKWKDPTEGVPNRAWGGHSDPWCGEQYGKEPCERPEPAEPPAEVRTEPREDRELRLPAGRPRRRRGARRRSR